MTTHFFKIIGVIFISMVVGCSNKPTDQAKSSEATRAISQGELGVSPPQCAEEQAQFVSGYQNFLDMNCGDVMDQISAKDLKRVGYRKQCQSLTGSQVRPKQVASVQVNECDQLRGKQGVYASMLVCCQDATQPETASEKKVTHYEPRLDCPERNMKALATKLHYPSLNCEQAQRSAEQTLTVSSYRIACQRARNSEVRAGPILDAKAFSCTEDRGAYLDVAICCSETLPTHKPPQQLTVPPNIWEALRKGDLLGIQLTLSRHPERIHERNENQATPLHLANSVAIVNVLLGAKASHKSRDKDGATPLHYAIRSRNHAVVKRLVKIGADVNALTNYGDAPLSFAHDTEMVNILINHNAKVNGGNSTSPLHTAAFYGRSDVARALIKEGANVDATDINGETPLHRAAFRNKLDMVKLLLDYGARTDIKSTTRPAKLAEELTSDERIKAMLRKH